jgi:hypothetical protein
MGSERPWVKPLEVAAALLGVIFLIGGPVVFVTRELQHQKDRIEQLQNDSTLAKSREEKLEIEVNDLKNINKTRDLQIEGLKCTVPFDFVHLVCPDNKSTTKSSPPVSSGRP